MTWANGSAVAPMGSLTLTDERGKTFPLSWSTSVIDNIKDPVARAVATELNQGGAATGTVTVTIS